MERFEKIKELGKGATGTVFKSFDNESGMLVALKMADASADGIDVVTHYRREIDMLSTLQHDGIVKIIAKQLDGQSPWVAYEFLKGHTLRELIASGKKFSPEEAIRITAEIARALDYIHNAGIVHRDINPNNIMITTDGAVKVMDFGIAHRAGEPFPKQLAGTPGYMSPETARGEEGGYESDIYSLGLICHELIANEPVYTGESVPEVIAKVVANDFLNLEKRKSDLDNRIYEALEKALQKNPQDRFSTANEFAIMLEQIISISRDTEEPEDDDDTISHSIPKLIGLAGPYKGYELDMGATITTFGGEYADIDLSHDAAIASQHCWIVPEDGVHWIYDAEDSGGTFIAGKAIKRARLKPGDRITIGNSSFKWDDPSDKSPPSRGHDEIEYASITSPRGIRDTRNVPSSAEQIYKHPPSSEMPQYLRMIIGTVIAVLVIYLFYGYILAPRAETNKIADALVDYSVEFKMLMKDHDPSANIQAINALETDFSYSNLNSIELDNSFFLSLPGPKQTRKISLKKIEVAITGCKAINHIRSDIPASEKSNQIESIVRSLEAIELPKSDTWEDNRLWLVNRLTLIKQQLDADAVNEQGTSTLTTSPTDAALNKLLDGYYLINEVYGNLSTDLALTAFDDFYQAREEANKVLEESPNDDLAKIIIILSNYFMVELRVDQTTVWQPQSVESSIYYLTEGSNLLDRMPDNDYSNNMPSQIDDNGFRIKRRLRAKYITLIDEFERATGANVENT